MNKIRTKKVKLPKEIGKMQNLKLNCEKMLEEICEIVDNDWLAEMELRLLPKSKPLNQVEAKKILGELLKVYSIAHCIHCSGCQTKYLY